MDPLVILLLFLILLTLIIVIYYLLLNKNNNKYINKYIINKENIEKKIVYVPIYKNQKCSNTKFGCCANGRDLRLNTSDLYCPKYKPIKKSGCQGSPFGCCPNGIRERKDPKGLNCPRIRQNI